MGMIHSLYVGKTPDGAEVTVDGQTSTKRTGDSPFWKGELVPGVTVDP